MAAKASTAAATSERLKMSSAASTPAPVQNCGYMTDNVTYVDAGKDVFIGKAPLPLNVQGAFWLVDDGGDALVAFGTPPDGEAGGECSNGRLAERPGKNGSFCTTISTVQPGGWTFQGYGTPPLFGGHFPTEADKFYLECGMKWEYVDSETAPTKMDLIPSPTRSGCVNVFALTTTTGVYKGKKEGGHFWRITTKAVGIVPMPSWLPGNFDMIQVMDGNGTKIQPAWDMFAAANKQIVSYDGR